MTDDKKITVLPTGYQPEEVVPDPGTIAQLQWDIALLADEIRALSVALNKLTKGMIAMNNKQQDILKTLRK